MVDPAEVGGVPGLLHQGGHLAGQAKRTPLLPPLQLPQQDAQCAACHPVHKRLPLSFVTAQTEVDISEISSHVIRGKSSMKKGKRKRKKKSKKEDRINLMGKIGSKKGNGQSRAEKSNLVLLKWLCPHFGHTQHFGIAEIRH